MRARVLRPALAALLLAAPPARAIPAQGIPTVGGTLEVACRPTGETDEAGRRETAFALSLDGKPFGNGGACDRVAAVSQSTPAMVPDAAGPPQPAIFNDVAFTDLYLEQRDRAGAVTLVSLRVDRDDPPTVVQWPGLLKPASIRYLDRDLVEIRFAIDEAGMLPAAKARLKPGTICIGQLNWAEKRIVNLVTDPAAAAGRYCEETFGYLAEGAR